MTGSVLQQPQYQQESQLACIEPSATASRSVVDAWLRKLRLHGSNHNDREQRGSLASPLQCDSQQQPKRKQPSFIKALFKPHELKAIKNSSPGATSSNNSSSSSKKKRHSRAPESNQSLDQQHPSSHSNQSEHVVPPVEIPSSYMGRSATHHSITVGGRRVPFTRDAHRRMKKKSIKALASVAETHPVSSLGSMSMAAYRSRAYYPAAASSSSSKQRKEKR